MTFATNCFNLFSCVQPVRIFFFGQDMGWFVNYIIKACYPLVTRDDTTRISFPITQCLLSVVSLVFYMFRNASLTISNAPIAS
jgi:hypothetical protein